MFQVFISLIEPAGATALTGPHQSLIVSILSAGTVSSKLLYTYRRLDLTGRDSSLVLLLQVTWLR